MGVPGLFAWLRRKYPQIVEDSAKDSGRDEDAEDNSCDNLYIDMNHIIHGCSHPKWRDSAYGSELEIFQGLQGYLERLVRTCRPERLVMIAIDGVAPQAKMCQQRTRRFMSAHTEQLRKGIEKEVRREMLAQARNAIIIPPLTAFDGNVITPGTPFMARLAAHLRQLIEHKVGSDPDWRHLQVVLSDSNEPGEGEHKIMRFIRHQRACPEYDPNTRHVIYGQDADLILLALLTHEPHFSLLREAGSLEDAVKEMGLDPADWSAAKHQPLQFLNISTLREYLRFEFRELVGEASDPPPALDLGPSDPWHQDEDLPEPAPGDDHSEVSSDGNREAPDAAHAADQDSSASGSPVSNGPNSISAETSLLEPVLPIIADGQFDFEWVLQDFVLLTFLSGNDFLPNIPSLEIYGRPSGLDVLLKTYKEQLPVLGGPITNGSVINMDRLKRMLAKLAADEEDAFKRLSLRKARDFQRLAEQEREGQAGAGAGYRGPDGSGQWVSMGELGSNDLDQVLGGLGGDDGVHSQVFDLLTATPEELTRELAQRVMKRLEERLKGNSDVDPVRLGIQGYRARLYEQRFGAVPGEGVEKSARKVSHAYMQGLNWVLAYYAHGNTPVPVSNAHSEAIAVAERRLQGKGKQSSPADSTEGLGASWDWYYPFHYAPLISDLAKFATGGRRSKAIIGSEVMSFDDDSWAPVNGPVRPLVQLMAVLPPESARQCLPWKLAQILEGTRAKGSLEQTSMAGALAPMFPDDLTPLIDMSGKTWAHTAIVKLPFADVKALATAAQEPDANEQELNPADEERNEIRAGSVVMHNSHPCATPLRLMSRQGHSWNKARTKLVSRHRLAWSAKPGRKSLSMLRLLVPGVHDPAKLQSSPSREREQFVSIADIDLAGVPVAPFSASLLPGCELPPAVLTEREWEREQRKLTAPSMAGRGGGFSSGRGNAAGGRGGYAARGQGRGGGNAVLTVPRRTAVPIKNPDRPGPKQPTLAWGQQGSYARPSPASNEPDWGDRLSWQPSSSSANLDDEAVARQLQAQYNREVNGGGFTSLEAESLAVARQLQAEEERKVRKDYKPPDWRTAQQMKADEDFAQRMQRQEREVEKHSVALYLEAQRRQQAQFDMGGVPHQDSQAVPLPDDEFPGLPTAAPDLSAEAPKWPVQRVRDKKKTASSTGWDVPDTPSHIPAVHRNSPVTDYNHSSYSGQNDGWDVTGGGGWGNSADEGKWGESSEQQGYIGWGGEQTNGYNESGYEEAGARGTAAADTQGGWGNEDESQAGWDHAQSGQGCGNEQADTSQEGQQAQGWGDEHAAPGWGNGHANHNDAAEKPSEQAQFGKSWGEEETTGGGWGGEEAVGSSRYEGSQGRGLYPGGKGAKEAAAAEYMQSLGPPPASSIKERAKAAAARIQQENAARQQREEAEMQQLEQQQQRRSRAQQMPSMNESGHSQPEYEGRNLAEYEQSDPFSQTEQHDQFLQYGQFSQHGQAAPLPPSAKPQSFAVKPALHVSQPASQTAHNPTILPQSDTEAESSDAFDVDAWLLDVGVGPAPQKQPPAAPESLTPALNVYGSQQAHESGQRVSQNGPSSLSRPQSSGSDSSRTRYRPPQMRKDPAESTTEAASSLQPPVYSNSTAPSAAGSGRKPPPGFSASAGY